MVVKADAVAERLNFAKKTTRAWVQEDHTFHLLFLLITKDEQYYTRILNIAKKNNCKKQNTDTQIAKILNITQNTIALMYKEARKNKGKWQDLLVRFLRNTKEEYLLEISKITTKIKKKKDVEEYIKHFKMEDFEKKANLFGLTRKQLEDILLRDGRKVDLKRKLIVGIFKAIKREEMRFYLSYELNSYKEIEQKLKISLSSLEMWNRQQDFKKDFFCFLRYCDIEKVQAILSEL